MVCAREYGAWPRQWKKSATGSRGWIEAGTRGLFGLQHATTGHGAPALRRIGLRQGSGENERGGAESKLYPKAERAAVTRFRIFGRGESQLRFQTTTAQISIILIARANLSLRSLRRRRRSRELRADSLLGLGSTMISVRRRARP